MLLLGLTPRANPGPHIRRGKALPDRGLRSARGTSPRTGYSMLPRTSRRRQRLEPAASSTRTLIHSRFQRGRAAHTVGHPRTTLVERINRENDEGRSGARNRNRPLELEIRDVAGHEDQIEGFARDLVGNVDVAAQRVAVPVSPPAQSLAPLRRSEQAVAPTSVIHKRALAADEQPRSRRALHARVFGIMT
jgi:hypothetical protein